MQIYKSQNLVIFLRSSNVLTAMFLFYICFLSLIDWLYFCLFVHTRRFWTVFPCFNPIPFLPTFRLGFELNFEKDLTHSYTVSNLIMINLFLFSTIRISLLEILQTNLPNILPSYTTSHISGRILILIPGRKPDIYKRADIWSILNFSTTFCFIL